MNVISNPILFLCSFFLFFRVHLSLLHFIWQGTIHALTCNSSSSTRISTGTFTREITIGLVVYLFHSGQFILQGSDLFLSLLEPSLQAAHLVPHVCWLHGQNTHKLNIYIFIILCMSTYISRFEFSCDVIVRRRHVNMRRTAEWELPGLPRDEEPRAGWRRKLCSNT